MSNTSDDTSIFCTVDQISWHRWVSCKLAEARLCGRKGLDMLPGIDEIETKLISIQDAFKDRRQSDRKVYHTTGKWPHVQIHLGGAEMTAPCVYCTEDDTLSARASIVQAWYRAVAWHFFLVETKDVRQKMNLFRASEKEAKKRLLYLESQISQWE